MDTSAACSPTGTPASPANGRPTLVLPEPLTAVEFELEGHGTAGVSVGWGDTGFSTVLHVLSAAAVIGDDVAYNGVHMMTAEADAKTRDAWIASLDAVAALEPRIVVAGHKSVGAADGPECIAARPAVPCATSPASSTKAAPSNRSWPRCLICTATGTTRDPVALRPHRRRQAQLAASTRSFRPRPRPRKYRGHAVCLADGNKARVFDPRRRPQMWRCDGARTHGDGS